MKKKFYYILLMWLMISVTFFSKSFAQPMPNASLYGRIIDDSTGVPIQLVNVFIANTMIGTTTDPNGFYTINHVPLGTHQLIASMMGYELEKLEIRLTEPIDKKINFRLKPTVLKSPMIEVSALYPHEWKKNLGRFIKYFLGTSGNASKCEILNPEVLDFEYYEESQLFTASASEPVRIENRALGYRIQFFLEDFRFNDKNNELKYRGIAKFEELFSQNTRNKKKWEKNRHKTYYGSLRHFLAALTAECVEDEGFFVYSMPMVPQKGRQQVVYSKNVVLDSLFSMGELPFERKLHFRDHLYVNYTHKDYNSWMKLNYSPITITTSGLLSVRGLHPITTFGYWGLMRVADMLPNDYEP